MLHACANRTAWNPLSVDVSASAVQTGVLSLYLNGYMTATALGAKSGVVIIAGKANPPAPQQVLVVNGDGPAATAVFLSSYFGEVALTAALAAAPTERTPATYISTTLSKLSS